jgi:hypothetical protein
VAEHLVIVASCTDRKRWAPPPSLQLRHTRKGMAETRAERWWDKLSQSPTPVHRAIDLYSGGHWSVVRQLMAVASDAQVRTDLWVASAGYGLVPSTSNLHAYSATFASGLLDSVCPPGLSRSDRSLYLGAWWQSISGKRGPTRSSSRRVRDLAVDSKSATLLVIASPNYVVAMEDDLLAARETLRHPGRLVVVSGNSPEFPTRLIRNRVTVSARLQAVLGGALSTLGARLALDMLRKSWITTLTVDQLRRRYQSLHDNQKSVPKRIVRPMSDEEVRKFLSSHLTRNPKARHTPMLRSLRNAGRSCEAKRFRRLFLERTR